jgi:hypothetical protein
MLEDSKVSEKLCDGDIYRWNYRDPNTDNRAYGSYHCCSRIAVVKNGCLRDTYWHRTSDGRWFGPEDLSRLDLKFVANFSDLESAKEYQANYYDDADTVDLNHANSPNGNFYLRKGAARSQAKMLDVALSNLERSLANERSAARQSEELRVAISRIEAGDTEIYITNVR